VLHLEETAGSKGKGCKMDRPLSADELRMLDRSRYSTGRSSDAPARPPRPEERKSARFSHIRRWTQTQSPEDKGAEGHLERETRPLLSSAAGVHAVSDDTLVPSKRAPLDGVREMIASSTTLSAESEQILADRAVTMAVVCGAWILMLQGLQGLQGLAFSYFMKDELKVSPATLSSINSFTSLPWVIKPLYGFTSDAFPIFGYRRKPYLFLSGLLGCLSWVCMSELVDQVWTAVICITVPSFAMAFANVLAEAMVVEKSRGHSQEYAGRLQTCIWGGKEVGAILSSFMGGWLLSFMTARNVFLLAALIPLSLLLVGLVLVEEPCETSTNMGEVTKNMRKLYRTFRHPRIWQPVAFLFLFNATPSAGSTWFYFYTDVTKFSSTFLGTMGLVGSIFSLLGVLLFDATLRKVKFLPIFIWGSVVSVVLGCTNIFLILRWSKIHTTHMLTSLQTPNHHNR